MLARSLDRGGVASGRSLAVRLCAGDRPGGCATGRVRRSALQASGVDGPVELLIEPGPSTIRTHLTVEELRARIDRSDVATLVVTRADGTLVGVLRRDDVPK